MMALAPALGRQTAHDLVYDLCRKAIETDVMLVDLLKESPQVISKANLSPADLERLCDPANYLGLSGIMVDRVLNNYKSQS